MAQVGSTHPSFPLVTWFGQHAATHTTAAPQIHLQQHAAKAPRKELKKTRRPKPNKKRDREYDSDEQDEQEEEDEELEEEEEDEPRGGSRGATRFSCLFASECCMQEAARTAASSTWTLPSTCVCRRATRRSSWACRCRRCPSAGRRRPRIARWANCAMRCVSHRCSQWPFRKVSKLDKEIAAVLQVRERRMICVFLCSSCSPGRAPGRRGGGSAAAGGGAAAHVHAARARQ
jgi:hypothetical protein